MKLIIIKDTGYFEPIAKKEFELKNGDICEILKFDESFGFKSVIIKTPHNHTFKLALVQDENNPWFKITEGI
jgi:hypothetical protein